MDLHESHDHIQESTDAPNRKCSLSSEISIPNRMNNSDREYSRETMQCCLSSECCRVTKRCSLSSGCPKPSRPCNFLSDLPKASRRCSFSSECSRATRRTSFTSESSKATRRTSFTSEFSRATRRRSDFSVDSNLSDYSILSDGIFEAHTQSKLLSLDISPGGGLKVLCEKTVSEAIEENTGTFGSICFVIRRPGCGLCREDGWTLNAISSLPRKPMEGFGMFGVIKETGVDDVGLSQFHSYFPYPLYRDDNKIFYQAFGLRKVKLGKLRNPFTATKKAKKIISRLSKKKIKTNFRGEGFVQGGVIFFGPDLQPLYALEEKTGTEISVEDVLAVVEAIKAECSLDR